MIIDGFEKLTLVNYPGEVACIVFTRGCNFACPFCQNSPLIDITKDKGLIDEKDVFDYLKKRKGIIDGVCISGGEPLLQKDIKTFIEKIKKMKLKVKLDTNGSNPKLLQELLDANLLDYVAMDIKNIPSKYETTIGKKFNLDKIKESMDILKNCHINYEFRTTIAKELHNMDDIKTIIKDIGDSRYYLQNFVASDNVIDKNLHGFSYNELETIKKEMKDYPNVSVR